MRINILPVGETTFTKRNSSFVLFFADPFDGFYKEKEFPCGVPIDYLLFGDCTIFDECFLTFFTIYKTSIFKIMIYGPLRQLICLWCFKTRLTNKNILNWGNFAAPFYTCLQLLWINITVLGCIRTWNLSLWRNCVTYYVDEPPKYYKENILLSR